MRSRTNHRKNRPASRPKRRGSGYNLSVLFIEEPRGWSAQVLDYDIATQAASLEELFYEVERILLAYIALAAEEKHAPFEGIPPAPKKYWEVFEKSPFVMRDPNEGLRIKRVRTPRIQKHIRIATLRAA
jgi:hypothetical protein